MWSGARGVGRRPSFHDAGGGGGGGGVVRADCQPQRRPPLTPAAQPGPSGGISGLGFIITRPSPGRGDPPARGALAKGDGR